MLLLFNHQIITYSCHPMDCTHQAPRPSLSPRVCSNSCPLCQWCHSTISSLSPFPPVINLSKHQNLFQCHFISDGQSIGASAPVPPMNIVGWFPSWLTRLISMLSKGLSKLFSSTKSWKHQFIGTQPSLWSNSHPYITTGKTITLTTLTFVGKVMSLLFNMLLRFVIVFLWRSNCLLILWLKSLSALTFEPKETKSITFSSSLLHEVLLRSFNGLEPGGPELKIRKWKRKRKRLIFLGLHRKQIKPLTRGFHCFT